VYRQKNTLDNFQIKLEEVPEPTMNENDVLVSANRVKGVDNMVTQSDSPLRAFIDNRSRYSC